MKIRITQHMPHVLLSDRGKEPVVMGRGALSSCISITLGVNLSGLYSQDVFQNLLCHSPPRLALPHERAPPSAWQRVGMCIS